MSERHWNRILWHVAAVVGALLPWWLLDDFAERMLAGAVAYFAVTMIADRLLGPMATADELRRDILRQVRRR